MLEGFADFHPTRPRVAQQRTWGLHAFASEMFLAGRSDAAVT